jgi:hypothetical protein
MPTSSERLRARAYAYEEAAGHLELDWTDNPMEFEEGLRLAKKLDAEYIRLMELADTREEKEQELEHRRKRTTK